ncbi:MAG: hypothetical protein V7749_01160 [Cocleimonas sp.]
MKITALLLLAFVSTSSLAAVPVTSSDEGLLWLADELSTLREASYQLQLREQQSNPNKFDFEAFQLDLSRMITEIKTKVHKKANPAYQYAPLAVESSGY